MSLPDPLLAGHLEDLAADLAAAAASAAPTPTSRSPQSRAPSHLRREWASASLRQAMRAAARRLARPIRQRITLPGEESGMQALQAIDELDHSLSSIRAEMATWDAKRRDLLAVLVHLELMKGDVRVTGGTLEGLGRAIAPAFGLNEAGAALEDMQARTAACERRLQFLETATIAASPVEDEMPSPLPPDDIPTSTLFDYSGFERRFRGRPADVLVTLDRRYGTLLEAKPPVLDIGCGRAELLALLAERGVTAMGVDTDPSMVADARERGLDVVRADAVTFLRAQPPASFGAIIATHVVEHLRLGQLVELLSLCRTRLRPGGILIAETPNPASLIVLGNSYILDPTHVRPLHPKLLELLCREAGFSPVELRLFGPASAYHIEPVSDPGAPAWTASLNAAFEYLNDVLFGPQDFAVLATVPVDPETARNELGGEALRLHARGAE